MRHEDCRQSAERERAASISAVQDFFGGVQYDFDSASAHTAVVRTDYCVGGILNKLQESPMRVSASPYRTFQVRVLSDQIGLDSVGIDCSRELVFHLPG